MSGTRAPKAQAMMGGGGPARAEQRQPPGGTSTAAAGSLTSTSLCAAASSPSSSSAASAGGDAARLAVGEFFEAVDLRCIVPFTLLPHPFFLPISANLSRERRRGAMRRSGRLHMRRDDRSGEGMALPCLPRCGRLACSTHSTLRTWAPQRASKESCYTKALGERPRKI